MITLLLWVLSVIAGWLLLGVVTGILCYYFQFPWKIPRDEVFMFPLMGPFATFVVILGALGTSLRWVNDRVIERGFIRFLEACEVLMLWVVNRLPNRT